MNPSLEHWLRQVCIALNQLGSALTGGWADETISARSWRLDQTGSRWGRRFRKAIDLLFLPLPNAILGGPNHCERAFDLERHRKQLPPELRNSKENDHVQ